MENVECKPGCLLNSRTSSISPTDSTTFVSTKNFESLDSKEDETTSEPPIYVNEQKYTTDAEYMKFSSIWTDETSTPQTESWTTFMSVVSTPNYYHKHIPQGDEDTPEKAEKRRKRSNQKGYISKRNGSTDFLNNINQFYEQRDLPILRHPYGKNDVRCRSLNHSTCIPERIVFKGHGPQTGMCVASDR